MQDPKELNDIGLKNLWILAPALRQLVPFYVSVKKYGLIQAGSPKPTPGEIKIPFMKSAQQEINQEKPYKNPLKTP